MKPPTVKDPSRYALSRVAPPKRLPLWQWAEANIILTPRCLTNFPGPYRTRLTPYLRGPADALDDPMIRQVVGCKGAQTGLTQLLFLWVINRAMLDPGPTLMMYPSEDLARYNSSSRFMPIVEDSPEARAALLPANLKIDWTNLQQRTRTCIINWIGGNSPANISSRPARYVAGDEVSKLPTQSKDESDPVNLLTQRQKTFEHNSKAFFISTPTIQGDAIMRLYERGDCRKLFCRCPHCLGWQVLKWSNVKFDSRLPVDEAAAGAFYECESCKHPWTDREKQEAVALGEWRPTQTPQDKGVASFHIPSFLAPWVKWPALVRKFLRSKNNPIEIQDFINSSRMGI
jgi:phage terminase large subunit GpA-like protein